MLKDSKETLESAQMEAGGAIDPARGRPTVFGSSVGELRASPTEG